MWLPDDGKFSAQFKYLEFARYVPDLGRVVRIMQDKSTVKIFEAKDIPSFREKNNNLGLYTSVFQYDKTDLPKALRLGSLYFDLDSDDGTEAQREAIRLVEYLYKYMPQDAVRIYFTGKKGFHVEAEAIALGISPGPDLAGLFRYVANEINAELNLNCMDFAVYDVRRMWRLPNSQHQQTNLYKVALTYELLEQDLGTIKDYATEPHFNVEVPAQQFSMQANEWFREWQYRQEAKSEETLNDRIQRFNKYGSSLVIDDDPNAELVFNPEIFEKCPSLMRLWEKSEKEHDLTHEERLFLCSILSFNKEAEAYLHAILSNCDDYLPDRTQSHIDDWVRRRELGIGGKPYSCQRANSAGVGCGSCELEPRDKMVRVGDKLVKTGEKAQPSPIRFGYRRQRREEKEGEQILPMVDKEELFFWDEEEALGW